ncbi:MAG TPA: TIM-barrel domain-containing protein [Bryobacteraceae bacterium]|nr:TIM-barrel domain-containing protein [Bryobacteraceae bacterium]
MSNRPRSQSLSRRSWVQQVGAAGAALLLPGEDQAASSLQVAGQEIEIQITPLSPHTFRLSLVPLQDGKPAAIRDDGILSPTAWKSPATRLRGASHAQTIKAGDLKIQFSPDPLSFAVTSANGETIQQLKVDQSTGMVSFTTGTAPLLGMGEGGPQFDRRGANDRMRSGQGGYQLATHGGRVPIPWVIGTSGWGLFIHQPYGAFDFTGPESKFQVVQPPLPQPPQSGTAVPPPAAPAPLAPLPIDLFFVASHEPATLMAEYARITGYPELPPLWSFGYQQSHRTLASREEILAEAKTFREKKLPCDTLIYLGTGFCPSGWNTNNTEFSFNQKVFPDPKVMFDQLHADHFKVVLHVAYPVRIPEMHGAAKDPCDSHARAETQTSCYWEMHRPVFQLGVDGWWPDEGDALNLPSRLVRNRMYWEAPQLDRPDERPFALHRNGAAGMQRYGAFLWSGDVQSRWETLKTHVPVAVNTGLSGIPYWGTDIGGFIPTSELTGELYVRWFQFASFCTLFRSHGRTWKLRLPWGWNTGETGPIETPNVPLDPAELHNAQVEPICRKYLELRYRMLPYLYSHVHEATATGMPVMRALWLHYPDDPAAVSRGDEYLWGRNLLVAPVVAKGATARQVYLPRGTWFDFWTGESQEGGREVTRAVDLETTPLYARAGSIVPMGPVKQYTSETTDQPSTISIYPGADAAFLLYEDDGSSFRYRQGEWMGIQMAWNDARRTLSLRLAPGSRMRAPARRHFDVTLTGSTKPLVFEGRPVEIKF